MRNNCNTTFYISNDLSLIKPTHFSRTLYVSVITEILLLPFQVIAKMKSLVFILVLFVKSFAYIPSEQVLLKLF